MRAGGNGDTAGDGPTAAIRAGDDVVPRDQAALRRLRAVTNPAFPEWAKPPVQYGPRLHAIANYLAVHQYMPYERMVEHVRDSYVAEALGGDASGNGDEGREAGEAGVEEIERELRSATAGLRPSDP